MLPPAAAFPMGTDDLGRDRFSRLLYATRVSVLLAPAAALVSILIALFLSATAGMRNWQCGRITLFPGCTLDALPLTPVDFPVHHHPARGAAAEHAAARVHSDNLWPDGNSGMGVAGANLHRFHTPDDAIGLAAAGARIRNVSLAYRGGTRLAALTCRRHRPIPYPHTGIHSLRSQPRIVGTRRRGAPSLLGQPSRGTAAPGTRAG